MRRFLKELIASAVLLMSAGCTGTGQAAAAIQQAVVTASPSVSAAPVFQVQQETLLDTLDEVRQQFPDLVYSSYQINNIPVLEVTPKEVSRDTPLVIFMHGVTGNKEIMGYILSRLASNGFRAVSFDLPGHGERTDGAYMFLDVIEQAEDDLTTMLDYYTQQGYPTDHYGLGGFSAGGMVTYSYAMSGKYEPDIIVPVSSIANWEEISKSTLLDACYEHSQLVSPTHTHEEELEQLEEDNPYSGLENLKDITVTISHGKQDTTFDWHTEEKTVNDLNQIGNGNVSLYLDEEGHVFPAPFVQIMLDHLAEVLQ